ncbi:Ribosomal protein [Parasponia andersonii]|uniref:Ribosomal protein L15 n=1 Tax=Parasponia andersonii TaxID=3476 RepID=A0A2P5C5D9_PARAD|nr:Ribosomal protein [Parasponia andersonii]
MMVWNIRMVKLLTKMRFKNFKRKTMRMNLNQSLKNRSLTTMMEKMNQRRRKKELTIERRNTTIRANLDVNCVVQSSERRKNSMIITVNALGISEQGKIPPSETGEYNYVSEIWRKKQSSLMRFVVRCWVYLQHPSIVHITCPTHPDKNRRLGYKAKQVGDTEGDASSDVLQVMASGEELFLYGSAQEEQQDHCEGRKKET